MYIRKDKVHFDELHCVVVEKNTPFAKIQKKRSN